MADAKLRPGRNESSHHLCFVVPDTREVARRESSILGGSFVSRMLIPTVDRSYGVQVIGDAEMARLLDQRACVS